MSDCLFPDRARSTAYYYGCRCAACRAWSSDDSKWRKQMGPKLGPPAPPRSSRRNRVKRRGLDSYRGSITPQACPTCGWTYTPHIRGQKACSKECLTGHPLNSRNIAIGPCGRCNEITALPKPGRGRGFYCRQCAPLVAAEKMVAKNRARRAKRAGSTSTRYTLSAIASRDGWRCHICGGKVDKRLSGMQRRGPTIDHLIPISAGGPDTPDNVALAHRECNVKRGATGPAQLRLAA